MMKRSLTTLSAAAAAAVALGAVPIAARAQLSIAERVCLEGVAKATGKFVKGELRAIKKRKNRALDADPANDCVEGEPQATTIPRLERKLERRIDAKCGGLNEFNLRNIGYPGRCSDPTPETCFDVGDLKE